MNDRFGSISVTVFFGIFTTSICCFSFANCGVRLGYESDTSISINGDCVNELIEIVYVEAISWRHEFDSFPSYLSGDSWLCIRFPVELACDFADFVDDQPVAGLRSFQFFIDLTLQLLYYRRFLRLDFRGRYHQCTVLDNAVDQQIDFHKQLTVTDANSVATLIVGACPALADLSS